MPLKLSCSIHDRNSNKYSKERKSDGGRVGMLRSTESRESHLKAIRKPLESQSHEVTQSAHKRGSKAPESPKAIKAIAGFLM